MKNILNKIVFERAGRGGLSPYEIRAAEADAELRALLDDSVALDSAAAVASNSGATSAPEKRRMLDAAYARSSSLKEDRFSMLRYALAGKRWYVQVAAVAAILLAVFAIANYRVAPTWAQEDGWVLEYYFGKVVEEGQDPETVYQPILDKVGKSLKELALSRRPPGEKDYKPSIMVNVMEENGELTMAISVFEGRNVTIEDVRAALSEVPGLPEPKIVSATWFAENGGTNSGLLSVMCEGHLFNFPINATEAEIESALNAWLAANKPGLIADAELLVNIVAGEDGSEKKEINLKIELKNKNESGK
ncbi:MAG: hypothetical protein HRF49_10710 [bacterium]|jgi:hypothetical protein